MLIEPAQEIIMQEIAVDALYREAMEAERRSDTENAYRIYEQIVATATDNLDRARDSIQKLRPCFISLLLQRAGEAHRQGAWQEEIDIWRQLLRFRPLQKEVDGQDFLLRESLLSQSMQTIQRIFARRSPLPALMGNVDEMIAERIRIAEQNMQYSDIYRNAQEEVSNHNLRAAKDLLLQLWTEAPYYGDPAGLARVLGMKHRASNYEQAIKRRITLETFLLVLNYAIFIFSSIYFSLSIFQNALLKISITLSTEASILTALFLLLLFFIYSSFLTACLAFAFLIIVITAPIAAVFVKEVETMKLRTGATAGNARLTGFKALLIIVGIIILVSLIWIFNPATGSIMAIPIIILLMIYSIHSYETISQLMEKMRPAILIGVTLSMMLGMILLTIKLHSIPWGTPFFKEFLPIIKRPPGSSYLLVPVPADLLVTPFFLLLLLMFVYEPIEVVIKPKRVAMRLIDFSLMIIEKKPIAKLSTDLKEKANFELISIKRELMVTKLPTRSVSLWYLSMSSTTIFSFCVSGLVPQTYLLLPLVMMLVLMLNFIV